MPATRGTTLRNVTLAVLGAAILVLKPLYHGPAQAALHAHAGNVSVSFALYFAAIGAASKYRRSRLVAGLATLLAVEAFEATDGFGGAMANTYDPFDFVANAAGVALAVVVDAATSRRPATREEEDA